jgi:hypothetical protein
MHSKRWWISKVVGRRVINRVTKKKKSEVACVDGPIGGRQMEGGEAAGV